MDNVSYRIAVEKYSNMVYRIAYNYCKNREDAEDIVQNTYLKLLNYHKGFDNDDIIKRWLIRVTINESKNMVASFWKKKISPLEKDSADMQIQFEEKCDEEFFEMISMLSEKNRIVTYLYYYEEYSTKEIASILNMKETAVQTRLMRARQKIKQNLEQVEDV